MQGYSNKGSLMVNGATKRVPTLKELAEDLHRAFEGVRATMPGATAAVVSREAVVRVTGIMCPDRKPGWYVVDGYSAIFTTYQTEPVRVCIRMCSWPGGRTLKTRYVVEGKPGMQKEDPIGPTSFADDDIGDA